MPTSAPSFILNLSLLSTCYVPIPYPAEHEQADCEALPAGDMALFPHASQAPSVFASAVEYVFGGQSTHEPAPVVFLNLPAPHAVHWSVGEVMPPVKPVLHVHCETTVLIAGDVEFPGHADALLWLVAPSKLAYVPFWNGVHTAVPRVALNVPGPHATHVPPFVPATSG